MSEPLDDAALDRLIDEAAGMLTHAPVRRDFQARVRSRIEGQRGEGWRSGWLIPGAAVATAGLALVICFGGRDSEDLSPAGVSPADVGSGFSRNSGADVPVAPPVVSGFGRTSSSDSRPRQPANAGGGIEEPPGGFESIANAALTIAPIEAGGLTSIGVLDVETIPMESLEVNPLSTQ